MYRGRLWTMRQYAGFGTAARVQPALPVPARAGRQTGLSVAFDLPTQMGRDSDHPMARGEVGRVGVAIDSLDDMRVLFDGIPLDEVSTSMTINATAAILLALYIAVGEEQGVAARQDCAAPSRTTSSRSTSRAARTSIRPPARCASSPTSSRTAAARCRSGTRSRSAATTSARPAADAVQEVAFTLADGIAYVEAALAAGLDVDDFAPRLSFFFNVHNNFLEEVAKFRAARALWARIMRDRFGAKNPSEPDAALPQPDRRRRRSRPSSRWSTSCASTLQALAAVLGGTPVAAHQRLRRGARPARPRRPRGSRCAPSRSSATSPASPTSSIRSAASWAVEALTAEIEQRVGDYLARIDELGGMVARDRAGLPAARDRAPRLRAPARGRGRSSASSSASTTSWSPRTRAIPVATVDPALEADQVRRVQALRARRSAAEVARALTALDDAAAGTANLVVPIVGAVKALATVGEIADVMRKRFGEYHPAR